MSIFNGASSSSSGSGGGSIKKIACYPVASGSSSTSYTVNISGFTDLSKMLAVYDGYHKMSYVGDDPIDVAIYISSMSLSSVVLQIAPSGSSGWVYYAYGNLYVVEFD